jgi:fructuronate reductase
MKGRLSDRALSGLQPGIVLPSYDRAALAPGIVHLGVGAFHRAHQAVHVDDRLGAGETGWGIVAASLRSPATRDALAPQDGLYTVAVRENDAVSLRVIGSIVGLIVAAEAREKLLGAMADPRTRIVSLTVTEKGYCRSAGSGALDEAHPDIRHDLADPGAPVTAPGLIVEALRRRHAAGAKPFAVLCCDNLPANGEAVRRVLTDLAALQGGDVRRLIAEDLACPSTMVDRIVPATTDADRAAVAAALGLEDAWPVMTEPFSQWVIEDAFGGPAGLARPRFEDSGAELVSDVRAYEKMKLRLLNGTHSTMAYLGQLAGLPTIADVVAEEAFARLVRALMDRELGPTVPGFSPAALDAYKDALFGRYANAALKHRTAQIAMDGSQKLPQRLVAAARERLSSGQPIALLGLAIAGFCRFMTGTGEDGAALPVNDPLASRFAEASLKAGAAGVSRLDDAGEAAALAARLARSMTAIGDVFGDLALEPGLVEAIERPLSRLYRDGARRTVQEWALTP